MITDNQRKRLENAGYKISKSGNSVLTKDGATIGGINSNGKVFAGSDTVAKILKGSGEKSTSTKSSTSERPTERRTAAKSESKAPTQSKRPKQRQTGRGEPNYGEAADKPTSTPMGGPRRGRKPTETKAPTDQPIMPRVYTPEEAKTQLLRSKNVSFGEWEGMSRQERKDKGLPTTTAGWQNKEFLENPVAWAKKQLGIKDKDTSGGSGGRRTTGSREYNKGGMVKSGNKDYKKSGMFYKSESPRGYK